MPPKLLSIDTILVILLIAITLSLFANTFDNAFIWDDKALILENRFTQDLSRIPFVFTPKYWKFFSPSARGHYRPIRTVTFALDHALWGSRPFGYHLTNLLLHVVNVILVYILVCGLCGRIPGNGARSTTSVGLFGIPFLTALFFAAHPIHTESVTWIKNRSDLLASVFLLSSLLSFTGALKKKTRLFHAPAYIFALLFFVLSLCSKEIAISFPLILILYVRCFIHKKERAPAFFGIMPFFIIVSIFFIFKITALEMFSPGQNLGAFSLSPAPLSALKTIGYYCVLLITPFNLSAVHIFRVPQSFIEKEIISSLIMFFFLLYAAYKTFARSRITFFAILWIFITLLPVSNIIFLYGRPIAEQRLYIPSVGFCLALALGINSLFVSEARLFTKRTRKSLAVSLCLFAVIFYSATTIMRNRDWKDSLTFWSKTVQNSPTSARAQSNLGTAYYHQKQYDKALVSYNKAITLEPGLAQIHYNTGILYKTMGKYPEAIAAFQKTVECNALYVEAYNNMGVAYILNKQLQEAFRVLKTAVELNPYYLSAYNNLGFVLGKMGKYDEAIALYKKTLSIDPSYAGAYNNLAVIYYQKKRYDTAIVYCDKALGLGYKVNTGLLEALKPRRKMMQ